ncbi:MAG: alpha/beta family hydrolase [Gemmatimonadota bacterium]
MTESISRRAEATCRAGCRGDGAQNAAEAIRFQATRSSGEVSALLLRPPDARWLFVFAHGAGAGMRHRFMEAMAAALADHRIATFRYHFPYMERGRRRPDPHPILLTTVRSAIEAAAGAAGDLPMHAGGKSMGGRMTSLAASEGGLDRVLGIAFFGFPLHAPGRPSTDRADHLIRVPQPMLFVQGSRDSLADLELLRPVCERLGDSATLHVVEGADHGFHVRKSSGRSDGEVIEELGRVSAEWAGQVAPK